MPKTQYPAVRSAATVVYKDGTVQTIEISASHQIAHHIVSEARHTGILLLRDDPAKRSVLIPIENIQNIEINPIEEGAA